MVYVSHLFRWQFLNPKNVSAVHGFEHDYIWSRCWSDVSWQEVSDVMYKIRGVQTQWRQDGNSLPYYLISPKNRREAFRLGAQLKDWDNPQLLPDTKPIYVENVRNPTKTQKAKRQRCEAENLAYQHETSGGTFSVLLPEEALLAATPPMRSPRKAANPPPVLPAGDPDPSQEAARTEPVQCGELHGGVPPVPPLDRDPRECMP